MKSIQLKGYGYTYEEALNEVLESVSALGVIQDVKLVDVNWLNSKCFECVFEIYWY